MDLDGYLEQGTADNTYEGSFYAIDNSTPRLQDLQPSHPYCAYHKDPASYRNAFLTANESIGQTFPDYRPSNTLGNADMASPHGDSCGFHCHVPWGQNAENVPYYGPDPTYPAYGQPLRTDNFHYPAHEYAENGTRYGLNTTASDHCQFPSRLSSQLSGHVPAQTAVSEGSEPVRHCHPASLEPRDRNARMSAALMSSERYHSPEPGVAPDMGWRLSTGFIGGFLPQATARHEQIEGSTAAIPAPRSGPNYPLIPHQRAEDQADSGEEHAGLSKRMKEFYLRLYAVDGVRIPSKLRPGEAPHQGSTAPTTDSTLTRRYQCPVCGIMNKNTYHLQSHFLACVGRNGNPNGASYNDLCERFTNLKAAYEKFKRTLQ